MRLMSLSGYSIKVSGRMPKSKRVQSSLLRFCGFNYSLHSCIIEFDTFSLILCTLDTVHCLRMYHTA